jgi:hypothetical protein
MHNGTVAHRAKKSMHLLLSYHRRFLLRQALGVRWRAALTELAVQRSLRIDETSISHVVSGHWRSKKIEGLITSALGLPEMDVFPEYHAKAVRPSESSLGSLKQRSQGCLNRDEVA